MSTLVVRPRSRIFHGHDWVYASEVCKQIGDPADGGVVTLKDERGRILGSAIYNSRSQIVARRISRQRQTLDLDFFRRRIAQAAEYRARRGVNPALCRVVWSESDGLPGLIIDRYGDTVVFQTLTLAFDRQKPVIVSAIRETLDPACIIERNDAPVRKAEGLPPEVSVAHGAPARPLRVTVHGLEFEIDPLSGQKTGLYLDQMESYPAVAALARGRRVLDCFCNQGAFALVCANAGAASVEAVEIGADLAALARRNAEHNGLAVTVREANAFDFLKAAEAAGGCYDLIVLDPPSFTRDKAHRKDALRGYKEIHLRALRLLSPDGILATFCCSHHIDEPLFREVIVDASVDAHRAVREIGRFSQAADHPILPHIPETHYLKGFLLEAMPAR